MSQYGFSDVFLYVRHILCHQMRFWSRIKILIEFTRLHKCFHRVVAYQNHSCQRYDQCLSSLLRLCVRSVCSFPMKLLIKSNFGKLCYLCYHQVLMNTSSYLFREKNTVLIFGKLNYYLPEYEWKRCKGQTKVRVDGWSEESPARKRYGCGRSERACQEQE